MGRVGKVGMGNGDHRRQFALLKVQTQRCKSGRWVELSLWATVLAAELARQVCWSRHASGRRAAARYSGNTVARDALRPGRDSLACRMWEEGWVGAGGGNAWG